MERWRRLGRCYRPATELAFNEGRLSRFSEDERAKAWVEQRQAQVAEMENVRRAL